MKAGELYGYHSGAPSEAELRRRARASCSAHANALFARARAWARSRTETRIRNPRREPRQTDNLVAAYERRARRAGRARIRDLSCSTPIWSRTAAWSSFAQRFPDRFVECGIAEQDMVSMAGGMARRGALPVVHSFACFLAARPNEQIYNQCSERSKVIYVGSLAGLLPGGPGPLAPVGARHLGARRGAEPGAGRAVRARPRCDALLDYLVERRDESAYLRLVSVKWPMPFAYPAGQPRRVGHGLDRARGRRRAWCSATARGCWRTRSQAAEELEQRPASASRLVNLPWLNRVDAGVAARGHRRRAARSSRSTTTTCTAARARWWRRRSPSSASTRPCASRASASTELPECGTNDEVLAYHRLDVAGLVPRLATALAPR